jgi:hypothetical protein
VAGMAAKAQGLPVPAVLFAPLSGATDGLLPAAGEAQTPLVQDMYATCTSHVQAMHRPCTRSGPAKGRPINTVYDCLPRATGKVTWATQAGGFRYYLSHYRDSSGVIGSTSFSAPRSTVNSAVEPI